MVTVYGSTAAKLFTRSTYFLPGCRPGRTAETFSALVAPFWLVPTTGSLSCERPSPFVSSKSLTS